MPENLKKQKKNRNPKNLQEKANEKTPKKTRKSYGHVNWKEVYKWSKTASRGELKQKAIELDVNYKTLCRKIKKYRDGKILKDSPNDRRSEANKKRCMIIDPKKEAQLSLHLRKNIASGEAVTVDNLRLSAHKMFFNSNQKVPSRKWSINFMDREGFTIKKNKIITKWNQEESPYDLALIFIQQCIQERIIHLNNIDVILDHSKIYNIDQTNIKFFANFSSIIEKDSQKSIPVVVNSKENISLIMCVAGDGTKLPPTFVVKAITGKILLPKLRLQFPNAFFLTSVSGWCSSAIMCEWITQVFLPFHRLALSKLAPNQVQDCILVADNFGGHTSNDFYQVCEENSIHLIYVPPQMTAVLQPLDKTVFASYKRILNQKLIPKQNPKKKVIRNTIIENAIQGWEEVSRDLICKGFRQTGIIFDGFRPFDFLSLKTFTEEMEKTVEEKKGEWEYEQFQKKIHTLLNGENQEDQKEEKSIPQIPKKESSRQRRRQSKPKKKKQRKRKKKNKENKKSKQKRNSKKEKVISLRDMNQRINQLKLESKTIFLNQVFTWRDRLLSQKDGENWLLDVDIDSFINCLTIVHNCQNVLVLEAKDIQDLRQHLDEIKISKKIELIILPTFYLAHWALVIINTRSKEVEYFNSKEDYEQMDNFGQEIAQRFKYNFINVFPKEIQPDSNDCGVFVCFFFAERIIWKKSIEQIKTDFELKHIKQFRREIFEVLRERDMSEREEKMKMYKQNIEINIHLLHMLLQSNQYDTMIKEEKNKKIQIRWKSLQQNYEKFYAWKKLIQDFEN
eukprot:Anaeramoba_ignava/a217369_139.p1 GENE.a217369_139~~a217369_139.p1  ORF type:complete len:790 (-),score=216.96 a217369_139:590-2959(-)